MKSMYIDWDKLWEAFEIWFEVNAHVWCDWPLQQKKIKKLVEAQLRKKEKK